MKKCYIYNCIFRKIIIANLLKIKWYNYIFLISDYINMHRFKFLILVLGLQLQLVGAQDFMINFKNNPQLIKQLENNKVNADSVFQKLKNTKTKLLFSDDCKTDWNTNWIIDGLKAKVENSPKGMSVYAGPKYLNDSDHVVLWTKQLFKGNILIEYDYTRLDTSSRNSVNIIYIQAEGSGKGKYKKNLLKWNSLRQIPAMNIYFDHMNTYHISYAVSGAKETRGQEYIRARRYMPETDQHLKGTALKQEYFNSGLFKIGITYHLTFIKQEKLIFFNVKGDGKNQIFYFSAEDFLPIERGRIGLRQMYTRSSRYDNLKVFQLK